MIVLVLLIVALVICMLAAKRRARIFNERDKSRDYRTTPQRMWDR
jgi:hypothetical protein